MDDIKIEGLDQLIKEFSELPDKAVKKIIPVTNEMAERIIVRARQKLVQGGHVKTGTLYKSLKVGKAKTSRSKHYVFSSVTFAPEGYYGTQVELGHKFSGFLWKQADKKRVEAKPFLRPAADELQSEIMNQIVAGMDKVLSEFSGGPK